MPLFKVTTRTPNGPPLTIYRLTQAQANRLISTYADMLALPFTIDRLIVEVEPETEEASCPTM